MSIDNSDYGLSRALEELIAEPVQAFSVFARFENFTHAAEELDIAMPSLHNKINKLQDRLGVELYVKDGRQLMLTPAGEELVRYAGDAKRLAQEALTMLRGSESSPMSIAAGRGGFLWVISSAVELLSQRKGGVKMLTAQNDEALNLVRRGAADIAVIGYDPPPEEFQSHLLGKYAQVVVVRKEHRLASRSSVSISDLDAIKFALPERGVLMRDNLIRAFRSADVKLVVEAEALDWDLLVRFVSYSAEATIVNEFVPVPDTLTKVPVVDLPPAAYYTVWREGCQGLADEFNKAFLK